MGETNLPSGNS